MFLNESGAAQKASIFFKLSIVLLLRGCLMRNSSSFQTTSSLYPQLKNLNSNFWMGRALFLECQILISH